MGTLGSAASNFFTIETLNYICHQKAMAEHPLADNTEALAQRFVNIRKYLGLTQRAFATTIGVTAGYISQVENGKRKASVEMLLGTAERFPQFDPHWLLTGKGAMLDTEEREPGGSATLTPLRSRSLQTSLQAEGRDTEGELALGEVATLARLGTVGEAWQIMEALLTSPREGLRLKDLAEFLGRSPRELTPHIALLQEFGSIEEDNEGRLRWASTREVVLAQTVPDKHQAALHAAQLLLHRVLPAQKRGQGRLELLQARVATGSAMAFAREFSSVLASIAERAEEQPEEAETLTVVFAVAAEQEDR